MDLCTVRQRRLLWYTQTARPLARSRFGVVHVEEPKSLCPRVRHPVVPQPVATSSLHSGLIDCGQAPLQTSQAQGRLRTARWPCPHLDSAPATPPRTTTTNFPKYTYANRPVPPSKLANRVMIGVSANGSSGSLQIVDGSATSAATWKTRSPAFRSRIFLRLSRHHPQLPLGNTRVRVLQQRREPDQHQLFN